MKALSVQQIADLSGGRLLHGDPAKLVHAVGTDTRSLAEGDLFIALSGERFDAHEFLQTALDSRAGALLVSRLPDDVIGLEGCPVVFVEDTLTGLQQLAKGYRQLIPAKTVAVTGSNGKTSTKDMIHAVLGSRFEVTATRGNLNNHIGLPLTILGTGAGAEFGIWEIGVNHPGEIAPLAELADPDIAVITNIGTAHIGNFGSREAIAREKGMLAEALSAEDTLVLNADDDFTSSISARTSARLVTAGIDAGDVRATALRMLDNGTAFDLTMGEVRARVELPIPGRHMVSNALLAAAVGLESRMSAGEIASALSRVSPAEGRFQTLDHKGIRIINDAYNANPDSMRASLTTVGGMKTGGKRIALLGQMDELGSESERAHREIGELALAQGFDHLCSVSEAARGFTAELGAGSGQALHHFPTHEEAAAFLTQTAAPGDLVLLKGSRSAAMETIYDLFAAAT